MMGFVNSMLGRFAIGAGLALLALVAFLSFQLDRTQEKLTSARADKRAAIAANEANARTIAVLESRVHQLDEINARLFDRYTAINRDDDEQRRAVEDLADADQNVAAFLEQPLPDELARVLFDARAGSGDASGVDTAGSTGEPPN
jgi:hypothetical protein